jgi:hypothetical protein
VSLPLWSVGSRVVAAVGDGVVLVALAFLALPLGVAIGVKREHLLSAVDGG